MSDYVQFLLNTPLVKANATSLVALGALSLGRTLPIITLAPFFGSRVLPHPVKIALALCIFACILPRLAISTTSPLYFNYTLIGLFVKELFVGYILGFFLGLPFLIVSSAGVYTDHQRGAASLMINDPTLQNQSSPLGTLYNMVLIVLFFKFDGPFYVIEALMDSYFLIPPDKLLNPLFFAQETLIRDKIYTALQIFVTLSLQLCAPALLALLMTDSFLGIINRLAPQVQITFLGMGLKSWLAILMVCMGWFFFVEELGKEIRVWLQEFKNLIPDFNAGKVVAPSS